MTELHVPVTLQRLEKVGARGSQSTERRRVPVGSVYFPEGTSANDVCVHIAERPNPGDKPGKANQTGIWLLQIQVKTSTGRVDMDDDCYTTVKDSKHKLTDDNTYVALHYTGPDIFLIK